MAVVTGRLSPFSYQNNRKEWKGEGQEPRVFSFKEGIWFCMMSLTPQGERQPSVSLHTVKVNAVSLHTVKVNADSSR